jgi:hypothetical protein
MIDTIKAKLVVNNLGRLETDDFNKISGTNQYNKPYLRYTIKNISIQVKRFDNGFELTITGSLSKFLYDTNLVRFTRNDVELAIEELSAKIGIDLSDAIIKRIDIAANLCMKHNPEIYHSLLSHKSRFKRSSIGNNETVSFEIGDRSLSFYNKKKEFLKRNRDKIHLKTTFSSFLKDKNLIRYELKLKKRLDMLGNGASLRLKDIYVKSVYRKLINIWYQQYCSISKDRMAAIKSAKKFEHYLIYRGITAIGGLTNAYDHLDSWVKTSNKPKQKKYSEKQKLKKILTEIKRDKLIEELDRKIKFEKEFYL